MWFSGGVCRGSRFPYLIDASTCSLSIIIHCPILPPISKAAESHRSSFSVLPISIHFPLTLAVGTECAAQAQGNGPLWWTASPSVSCLLCQKHSPESGKEQQRGHKGDNLSLSQTPPWKQLIFPFIHPEPGCGSYLPVNQTEWSMLPFKVNLLKKKGEKKKKRKKEKK